jgi:hypothetical protein
MGRHLLAFGDEINDLHYEVGERVPERPDRAACGESPIVTVTTSQIIAGYNGLGLYTVTPLEVAANYLCPEPQNAPSGT